MQENESIYFAVVTTLFFSKITLLLRIIPVAYHCQVVAGAQPVQGTVEIAEWTGRAHFCYGYFLEYWCLITHPAGNFRRLWKFRRRIDVENARWACYTFQFISNGKVYDLIIQNNNLIFFTLIFTFFILFYLIDDTDIFNGSQESDIGMLHAAISPSRQYLKRVGRMCTLT